MPFFGSISEIFPLFSPRRPHADRQHPSLSQPADTRSTRPRSQSPTPVLSRQTNRKKSEFSLGFKDDDDDDLEELREQPLVNAPALTEQSDANPLSPYPDRQLRSPTSQCVADSSVRPGLSPPMLNKDWKRFDHDRQEEARLLGVQNVKDEGAFIIKPGATFQKHKKNPGSSAAFKPTDRISQHARQSGPVRAEGKSKQPNSHLGRNPPLSDSLDDFEDSGRPSKRRRHNDLGNAELTREPASDPLSRLSPGSSQYSASKPKSNAWFPRHDEYRGVEQSLRISRSPRRTHHRRFSDESQYDTFTVRATQQRHSLASDRTSPESHKQGRSRLETGEIEVSGVKNIAHQHSTPTAQAKETSGIASSRESPDELQGEVTTQPVPTTLGDKSNQTRRKHQAQESPMSPSRKRSPTDIQPTDFAGSPRQGPKKVKRTQKNSRSFELEVISLRFGHIAKTVQKGESATIDLNEDGLEIGEDIAGPGKRVSILLRHVVHVIKGREPSMKIRLKLAKKTDAPGDLADIEFLTLPSKVRLMKVLQDNAIKIQDKDMSYMEKAFAHHERELMEHGNSPPRPFLDFPVEGPALPQASHSSTRKKLSSGLQNSSGESVRSKRKAQADIVEDLNSLDDAGGSHGEALNDEKHEADIGVEIPVKTYRGTKSSERETRATTRRTTRESDRLSDLNERSPQRSRQWSPEDDPAREKWKKPLVYPPAGKKRAEVNVEDRDRLREGEFLNDNLIGLYMRFLQDHLERTNPKAANQVYFFNSYFFATLTNTAKGDRGINYSGVEKWTRSVDLFSYDYIVVPINQSAHWFVAIICNLPSLCPESGNDAEPLAAAAIEQKPQKQSEIEVREIPESPAPEPIQAATDVDAPTAQKHASESPDSQQARQSLASMTLEGQKEPREAGKQEGSADEWPDREENPASPQTKLSPSKPAATPTQPVASSQSARKRKKKARAGPKLDPNQTTIVTFDSLGHSRSPTIRILREYIQKEAASKRGMDIDSTNIKGMSARQIPLQPNFSDCGLYLLAYLEKFVQDPDPFTRKLLRREMDQDTDWPPLGSGLLRHRLRDFLDNLYEEQSRLKEHKELLSVMADQQPVSFLLGPPLPSQDVEDQAQAEPAPAEAPPESKDMTTQPGTKEGLVLETPEPADEESADALQLVPTGSVRTTSDPAKEPPEQSPTDVVPDKSRRSNDENVTEVPDSQEPIPASRSRQDPGPSHDERKKSSKRSKESHQGRKPERKKAAIPIDADLATISEPSPQKPAKTSKVEIQIRGTPPPTDEPVRKSPRGPSRKT